MNKIAAPFSTVLNRAMPAAKQDFTAYKIGQWGKVSYLMKQEQNNKTNLMKHTGSIRADHDDVVLTS